MTKLKCPFCQQEFREIYFNGVGVGYICPNPNCKPTEHFKGNQELWQALIDTMKKLDIAVDLLKIMNEGLPNGNTWKWKIEKALDKIKDLTPLEQKDYVMRQFIDVTLLKTGKKYLLEPCCCDCHANVNIQQIESFSGKVLVAYCSKCGNYLKVIKQADQKDVK